MSQTGKYLEPILLQMKSELSTNLATNLTAIDTVNGTFTSHTPMTFWAGRMYVLDVGQCPALVCWPEGDAGGEYTNETLFFRARVTVWVIDYDDDQERLTRRLLRLQEAIVKTLKTTENLNGECDLCSFVGMRFDNPWTSIGKNSYMDAMGVTFEIHKEEAI